MAEEKLSEHQTRLNKREELFVSGINPYPARSNRTASVADFLATFEHIDVREKCILGGRVRALRRHGGSLFGNLEDASGTVQFFVKKDQIGEENYKQLREAVDLGDIIEIGGTAFLTKQKEKTMLVEQWQLLTKAVRPLPDKWSGLENLETKARQPYLDFLANPRARQILQERSAITKALRMFLDDLGYQEVETPELQPLYGGGFARPFITHHNALDIDLYLRISNELYLKRMIVGGFEKIYEFSRDFRNEGIDQTHNPEFTQLEIMTAYEDYHFSMDLVERIYEHVAQSIYGRAEFTYSGHKISLGRPWNRFRFYETVSKVVGATVASDTPVKKLQALCSQTRLTEKKKEEAHSMTTAGEIAGLLFEELVEDTLIQPTIVYDYPVELSPLAKQSTNNPKIAERFEHFIAGKEHGNHYSELNDPVELRKRFIEEKNRESAGFDEAHQTDEDFVEAIEYGMPPVTGIGIGIDRMTMFFTGTTSIRDVIAFPTVKPLRLQQAPAPGAKEAPIDPDIISKNHHA